MADAERTPGFSTLSIHAGAKPDPTTGARATPIYQTTSFVFDDVDHAASLFGLQAFGNIYTRIGNPTSAVLEERVAALEGGTAGLAVASGHAAQVIVMHALMTPGDEFVASKKLYGGSINQFNHSYKNFGWNVVWADPDDIASFEKAVTPKTKAIFIESIANPGGVITDIEAVAKIARKANVPLIVDNTLATPYLCKPIDYGADIVVHSLTKFLGGHGNSIGGLIVDGGTLQLVAATRHYPMLSEPRPEYSGMVLDETFGNFAFAIACRVLGLRDLGPGAVAVQCLPHPHRHRDAAAAHAAPFRQHARRRAMAGEAAGGRLGELSGAGERQISCARQEIRAEGRRRGVHLRAQGRLRRRRQAGVERQAVLASRQYRRHPLADHPPRFHHAQTIVRRAEGAGRRRTRRGAAVDRTRGQRGHHRRSRGRPEGDSDRRQYSS